MKKVFLVSLALALAQVVLITGIVVLVSAERENQSLLKSELRSLRSAATGQEHQLRELDQNHNAVSKQIGVMAASLQSISEQLISLGSKQESKLESISTKIAEKPVIQPLRWAYVDKFKLKRIASATVKVEPLPVDQDPDKNPDLAKKWTEYQKIQSRLAELNPMGDRANPFTSRDGIEKKRRDEHTLLQDQLAQLRVPLAAYLSHKSSGMTGENELIDRAIREYGNGKFDLLLDKTFGDHHIYYRSPQPVPDVTDAVAQILREMAAE